MKSENGRKKIRRLKSINFVLSKYFLVFTFVLIMVIEGVIFVIVNITSEGRIRERLTYIGKEVTMYVNTHNEEEISRYLYSYRHEGINLYIISTEGEALLPLDDVSDIDWGERIEGIKSRLEGYGPGEAVIYEENDIINFVTVVKYGKGSFLVANYSLRILKDSMKLMIGYFIGIGMIVLAIAALLSYSISQRLSSGLRNISTTAVRLAKGDLTVNFANAEYQELADLSDTLNIVRDEVKKSGDFQRELLANVSHDLKTPLTMIKAYASMIREISGDNPEKRDKHLQVIIDESDRLTSLVNDVLSVSKVNSNLAETNKKVFNLTEFLYGIINKFEYLQETQGYNIMVDVDANLYTSADDEKIGQVIYNLLGNAVNYTGEDKTVYISLKSQLNGRIKLSVRDTGKGIAKEDLPEIWNRYYRVKENHSRPVKGTGLGLNIVKIILENHNFDYGVNSELGKGSTFWVDFPSVPADIEIK